MKKLRPSLLALALCLSAEPLHAALTCSELFNSPRLEMSDRDLEALDAELVPLSELTNIRNFSKGMASGSGYFMPRQLNVSTHKASFVIGLGRVGDSIRLNLVNRTGGDPVYLNWLARLTRAQFDEFAFDGSHFSVNKNRTMAVELDSTQAKEIAQRFEEFAEIMIGNSPQPLDTIPRSLKNRLESEKIDFIRTLLIDFLAERGIESNEKFMRIHLPNLHRRLIESLNQNEIALFHYSIFDKEMTFEARANISYRLEKMNGTNELMGLDPINGQSVLDGIRAKFFNMAKKSYDTFYAREKELRDARTTLLEYQSERYEERKQELGKKIRRAEIEISELTPTGWAALLEVSSLKVQALRQKQIEKLQIELEKLEKQYAHLEETQQNRIDRFNEAEKRAFSVLKREEQSKSPSNSNINPYALDLDFIPLSLQAHVSRHYGSSGYSPSKNPFVSRGVVSETVPIRKYENILEFENFGTNSDLHVPLRQSGMKADIVSMLESFGINSIYEISRYSARDFLEKFQMSRDNFEKFLDELNALGVDLHFDGKWDRNNHNIRKGRPEYHRYRHTPKGVIWWDDYVPHPNKKVD